jgi:hypothetical protein
MCSVCANRSATRRIDDDARLLGVEILLISIEPLMSANKRHDHLALGLERVAGRPLRRDANAANCFRRSRLAAFRGHVLAERTPAITTELRARYVVRITVRITIRQRATHSAQNFLPGIRSVPHFEQRILGSQLVEQRLGVFQVGGIEAFCEPAVDLGEHGALLVDFALPF